jgi:hypothetical protein
MEGPARPDLREAGVYVGGFEDRSRHPAGDLIGDETSRQALRYTELLRALDAIGDTVDRLNAQVRALLTRVGCELAQQTREREPD